MTGTRARATIVVSPPPPARAAAQLEAGLLASGAISVERVEGATGVSWVVDLRADDPPRLLRSVLHAHGLDTAAVEVHDEATARERWPWRRRVPPVRIGPLTVIEGSARVPTDTPLVLRIEPGMALGTAVNAATALCLEWLIERRPRSLLDVGTGTGILALAAARLGTARVVGVDSDGEARAMAAENAVLNGLAGAVELPEVPAEQLAERFEVVIANIITEALVPLARTLAARRADDGVLALGGVRPDELGEIVDAFAPLDLEVVDERSRSDVSLVVLAPRRAHAPDGSG